VVFQVRQITPTYNYTIRAVSQYLTRVKLKRVFFPHIFRRARSLDSEFARLQLTSPPDPLPYAEAAGCGSRGRAYVPENDTQPTFPMACRRLTLLSRPDCDVRSPAPPIAPRPDRGSFPACAVAIVRLERGSRLRLDRAVENRGCTQAGEDLCTTWCGSNACIVSISRARASMLEPVHGSAHGFRIRSRWVFDPSTHPRLPSRVVRLPFRATSLTRSGRRARTPSPCRGARHLPVFSFRKNDPSLRARVGRGPSATPVHSTDVCNSRFCFQGNACSSSRCTPRRVSPRGAGTLGSRRVAHFSELNRTPGALSSPVAPAVRTSDPSSLRGLPGGARLRPPASARRSSCDDPRVVPESLGLLHHAA
jgi:hypothetical protein